MSLNGGTPLGGNVWRNTLHDHVPLRDKDISSGFLEWLTLTGYGQQVRNILTGKSQKKEKLEVD